MAFGLSRPPQFLRSQSSPVLRPTNLLAKVQECDVSPFVVQSLSLPLLIITPSLSLYFINEAGRAAFNLPSSSDQLPARAEPFFWTGGLQGVSTQDRILRLLYGLAFHPKEAESWGSGDAVEFSSIGAPGHRWWAEARIDAFTPSSDHFTDVYTAPTGVESSNLGDRTTSNEWFSIVLLRPLPATFATIDSRRATPRSDSLWDRTPVAETNSRFGARVKGHELHRSPEASNEDAWAHSVPQADHQLSHAASNLSLAESESSISSSPAWNPIKIPTTNKVAIGHSGNDRQPNMSPIDAGAKHSPSAISAISSPVTPPLSSAGTTSSRISQSSQLTGKAYSVSSSDATSLHSAKSRSQAEISNNPSVMALGAPSADGARTSMSSYDIEPSKSSASPASSLHQFTGENGKATSASSNVFSGNVASRNVTGGQPAIQERSIRPAKLPPRREEGAAEPEIVSLLQFAALSNLPKTGVIIADTDLKSGFVNGLARELLMGISENRDMHRKKRRSATPASSESTSAAFSPRKDSWWTSGRWTTEDEWSTLSTGSESNGSFFSPQVHVDHGNAFETAQRQFEARDLTYSAIIAAGEGKVVHKSTGSGGSSIRVGKPSSTNRYRTTVANILARSLIHQERQNDVPADRLPPSWNGGEDESSHSHSSSSFIPMGTKVGKKPYKIYDATFSQRIIDPLEPLLEICARRGENPATLEDEADEGGAASGMIIGIEVEVLESTDDASTEGIYVPPTYSSRAKRVRRRLVEISGSPIFAPGKEGVKGQHLGGVLLLRDVTDEKHKISLGLSQSSSKGSALREGSKRRKKDSGESYFKQILDHMPQMVWTTTPLGSHDFFNCQWYDYTGLEPEQSLGLGWQSPFHEDDMPNAIVNWTHSLETGDPYSVEYRCKRHDGVWRWMLGRALPFRDAEGTIQGWFGTCTDVDEFVNIRAELSKTQEQFTAIIQGAEVLLWAIDTNWKVTFFEGSKKASLLKGDTVEGKDWKDVWARDHSSPSPLDDSIRAILEGKATSLSKEWTTDDESKLFYRCCLTPLTETRVDGSVHVIGCIVVSTDLTDLNSAQEQLKESYEAQSRLKASETAANEASRLKSSFVANISHEIRTPIGVMIGMAELLLDEPTLAEAHRNAVAKIMRSGEILLEMVGMVLDMGKVEAGKLDLEHRPFTLEDIISDARMFTVAAERKGLRFSVDVGALYVGKVYGDMPRLRQILSNLLSNAIKFTRQGAVALLIHQSEETDQVVHVSFEVKDTGIGVKPEAIPMLFKPFHQADASTARMFGGTGLGLCIAKNLIELMGGSIVMESEYGYGTKMIVNLPLQKCPETLEAQQETKPVPFDTEIDREAVWILVTDDNELNREIIQRSLQKMRFNVDTACNGREAIQKLRARKFDLVLMDGQMPEMDGFEATIRIRQAEEASVSQVKIIALTASAIVGEEEKCLKAGMNGYLSKPVRSKLLELTILRHLSPSKFQASGRRSLGAKVIASPAHKSVPSFTDSITSSSVIGGQANTARRPSYPTYSSEAL